MTQYADFVCDGCGGVFPTSQRCQYRYTAKAGTVKTKLPTRDRTLFAQAPELKTDVYANEVMNLCRACFKRRKDAEGRASLILVVFWLVVIAAAIVFFSRTDQSHSKINDSPPKAVAPVAPVATGEDVPQSPPVTSSDAQPTPPATDTQAQGFIDSYKTSADVTEGDAASQQ